MSKDAAHRIFVTVGSTKFHALVKAILSKSTLDAISKAAKQANLGEVHILVQFGATAIQEILFDDKDGLQSTKGQSAGTLPIKILSQKHQQSCDEIEDVVDSLSPEMIKKQQSHIEDDRSNVSLKHFAMDWQAESGIVHLELVDYVTSIKEHLEKASIVISHAGSGTILEALRLEEAVRPKLIVVPNETLMDNHQTELAKALSERHYVYAARLDPKANSAGSLAGNLPRLLHSLLCERAQTGSRNELQEFPAFVPGRFRAFVDEEMGFLSP